MLNEEKRSCIVDNYGENNLMYSDMEDMNTITVNINGENINCDVLFTFDNEENNKSYIVYTDNTKDETGNTRVYASTYVHTSDTRLKLSPLENDHEWKIIEIIIDTIKESIINKDGLKED